MAIVFNGSPLFAGGPGSGESEIRRWVIENDWLEAIIALPDQLFYNTAIATYVWVVTNHKAPRRRGKIQLIDGTRYFERMQKSLGDKRKALSDDHIRELTRLHDAFEPGPDVRILDNQDFGFRRITVERPQKSGRPDPELREHEDVPLKEDVAAYFEREVRPHVPDAWVDHSKTKVGYTIPFARHFHVYEAPRSPEVIEAEIRQLETEIQEMLREALR